MFKVTQLVSDEAHAWADVVWLQSPHLQSPLYTASERMAVRLDEGMNLRVV